MGRRGEIILGDKRIYSRMSGRVQRRIIRVIVATFVVLYVAWALDSVGEETKKKQALLDISRIEHVVRLFRADVGRCPDDMEELGSPAWENPYQFPQTDPWGQPYLLQCPSSSDPGGVTVYSGGPDGIRDGENDITSI